MLWMLALPAIALADEPVGGVYGPLTFGLDPKSRDVTGAYVSGACTFQFYGTLSGVSGPILAAPPGATGALIAGTVTMLPGAHMALHLDTEPAGCAGVQDFVAPVDLALGTPHAEWISVRMAKSDPAQFHSAPGVSSGDGSVPKGHAMGVLAVSKGWVNVVSIEAKPKTGWMADYELFPIPAPAPPPVPAPSP